MLRRLEPAAGRQDQEHLARRIRPEVDRVEVDRVLHQEDLAARGPQAPKLAAEKSTSTPDSRSMRGKRHLVVPEAAEQSVHASGDLDIAGLAVLEVLETFEARVSPGARRRTQHDEAVALSLQLRFRTSGQDVPEIGHRSAQLGRLRVDCRVQVGSSLPISITLQMNTE